jgi:hypothetical protein
MLKKKKQGIVEFGKRIRRELKKISGVTAKLTEEKCEGKIIDNNYKVTWSPSEADSMKIAIEGEINFEIVTVLSQIFGQLPYCSYFWGKWFICEWSMDPTAKHKVPWRGHIIDIKKIDIHSPKSEP